MSHIIDKEKSSKQITDRGYFQRDITRTYCANTNKEKDPNKLRIVDNSAGRGPFYDTGIPRKRNRTAKNSVTVRPLKVNWAV